MMDPEEVISPVSPRKARKRPNRPEAWKRNIAKKLRQRPKTDTNKSKVIHTRFFVRKNESSDLVPV
ncbi:hypothetical protein J6590_087556 [Homalodisca vitripennis]|nr:hypothetical protein J6590_087556 [Homalodisca vitripennis]